MMKSLAWWGVNTTGGHTEMTIEQGGAREHRMHVSSVMHGKYFHFETQFLCLISQSGLELIHAP